MVERREAVRADAGRSRAGARRARRGGGERGRAAGRRPLGGGRLRARRRAAAAITAALDPELPRLPADDGAGGGAPGEHPRAPGRPRAGRRGRARSRAPARVPPRAPRLPGRAGPHRPRGARRDRAQRALPRRARRRAPRRGRLRGRRLAAPHRPRGRGAAARLHRGRPRPRRARAPAARPHGVPVQGGRRRRRRSSAGSRRCSSDERRAHPGRRRRGRHPSRGGAQPRARRRLGGGAGELGRGGGGGRRGRRLRRRAARRDDARRRRPGHARAAAADPRPRRAGRLPHREGAAGRRRASARARRDRRAGQAVRPDAPTPRACEGPGGYEARDRRGLCGARAGGRRLGGKSGEREKPGPSFAGVPQAVGGMQVPARATSTAVQLGMRGGFGTLLGRRESRFHNPRPPARRGVRARGRLPPLVPRDGRGRDQGHPRLHAARPQLLQRAAPLRPVPPEGSAVCDPRRLDPGGAVPGRPRPVGSGGAQRAGAALRGGPRRGIRQAPARAATRHGLGPLDRRHLALGDRLVAGRGVGPGRHCGLGEEEPPARLRRPLHRTDRGVDLDRGVDRRARSTTSPRSTQRRAGRAR